MPLAQSFEEYVQFILPGITLKGESGVIMGFFSKSNRFVVFFSALGSVLLSLSGSVPTNAAPSSLDGWTIDARRPEYLGEDLIIGKFTLERENAEAAKTRGGGACLVADLNDNFPCETRQDCLDAAAADLIEEPSQGGFLYCEALDGEVSKRCWTRPTGQGCTRGPRTLAEGDYLDLFSILDPISSGAVSPLVDGKKVLWVTMACLAVDTPGTDMDTGCASEDPSQHTYSVSPALDPGLSCDEESNICTPICGDGFIRGEESCDDGNVVGEDGCSAECSTEAGYTCEGEPSQCIADEPSQPDDGSVGPGDDDGEDSGVGGGPTGTAGLGGAGGCSLTIRE